jgi:hypothetical protein
MAEVDVFDAGIESQLGRPKAAVEPAVLALAARPPTS